MNHGHIQLAINLSHNYWLGGDGKIRGARDRVLSLHFFDSCTHQRSTTLNLHELLKKGNDKSEIQPSPVSKNEEKCRTAARLTIFGLVS